MGELATSWYSILQSLGTLSEPVREAASATTIGPLAAFLFGLVGSLAPCQVATSLGAIALIGRRPTATAVVAGIAYAAGKATTYALLGLAVVAFGRVIGESAAPVAQLVRRVLGPFMLLAGLALLGVLRPRAGLALGGRLLDAATSRLDPSRPRGAYGLGLAFGLAFCPTLFLLFFGVLVPLALASPAGALYPPLFALGTAVPVVGALALLWSGAGGPRLIAPRMQHVLTVAAGGLAVFVGLSDTLLAWGL